MRDVVGPDVQIMVEGHKRFSVHEAVMVADQIAPNTSRPGSRSRPTSPKSMPVVEVARHTNVPIATGESFSYPYQFAELLAHNAVHILQPDPSTLGGILRTRMVCAMVDAFYGVVAPHQAQGPLSTSACIQIGACTPNLMIQELFDEFNADWEHDIVTNPVKVVDGRIQIPTEPGSGQRSELDRGRETSLSQVEFPAALQSRLGTARRFDTGRGRGSGRRGMTELRGCIPILCTPFNGG